MLILGAEDYQEYARSALSPDVWDYVDGGSGAEVTLAANREAFAAVRLRPRVLVDVSSCPTSIELLGASLRTPVAIAPLAYHGQIHPDGEVATARGAGEAGALFVVSIFASRSLEDIAAAATGPLWLQLYWLRRREVLEDLAARAVAAGYQALVLTVDTPRLGRRIRDLRNGFAVAPEFGAANVDPDVMASASEHQPGVSAIAAHADATFDTRITWSDLAWLRGLTNLPLLLKGIVTAEDARLAVEHGVDGIIVSNHGGRQLDGAVGALDALPEVVDAVAGHCPVLVDGGVRHGRDVFAALALGASAVLIGRPALWGLAVDGAAGVTNVVRLLTDELAHTMALTGRPSLAGLDRSAVVYRSGDTP